MELILHLENFNKSLSFNKSNKNNKFHDVLNAMEIFNELCYPKFKNKTDEQNKPLTIKDNKFEWNSVKYLYVENYDAYTESKQERKALKDICIKISNKFQIYFFKLSNRLNTNGFIL